MWNDRFLIPGAKAKCQPRPNVPAIQPARCGRCNFYYCKGNCAWTKGPVAQPPSFLQQSGPPPGQLQRDVPIPQAVPVQGQLQHGPPPPLPCGTRPIGGSHWHQLPQEQANTWGTGGFVPGLTLHSPTGVPSGQPGNSGGFHPQAGAVSQGSQQLQPQISQQSNTSGLPPGAANWRHGEQDYCIAFPCLKCRRQGASSAFVMDNFRIQMCYECFWQCWEHDALLPEVLLSPQAKQLGY